LDRFRGEYNDIFWVKYAGSKSAGGVGGACEVFRPKDRSSVRRKFVRGNAVTGDVAANVVPIRDLIPGHSP
jgi:hypothetical protein